MARMPQKWKLGRFHPMPPPSSCRPSPLRFFKMARLALLVVLGIVAADPDLSRPRQGGRLTAWREAEP